MVRRHTVNRVVFVGAAAAIIAGWLLSGSGARTGNLSTVLISTGFFAGVWSVVDIPRRELVAIVKVTVAATAGFIALYAIVTGAGVVLDGGLATRVSTWLVLLGQALGTVLLAVLPVLVGRDLLNRFRDGSGWSRDEDRAETPEERVLSDSEYEDFDQL